jgi:hypothetical protein
MIKRHNLLPFRTPDAAPRLASLGRDAPRTKRRARKRKDLKSSAGRVELTERNVRYNPLPILKFRVRDTLSISS